MLREEDARGRFTGECAKNDVGGPGGQPFKGPSGAARVPPAPPGGLMPPRGVLWAEGRTPRPEDDVFTATGASCVTPDVDSPTPASSPHGGPKVVGMEAGRTSLSPHPQDLNPPKATGHCPLWGNPVAQGEEAPG